MFWLRNKKIIFFNAPISKGSEINMVTLINCSSLIFTLVTNFVKREFLISSHSLVQIFYFFACCVFFSNFLALINNKKVIAENHREKHYKKQIGYILF